jgi:hypothetical protein
MLTSELTTLLPMPVLRMLTCVLTTLLTRLVTTSLHTVVALDEDERFTVRHLPLTQLEAGNAAANVAQQLRNICAKIARKIKRLSTPFNTRRSRAENVPSVRQQSGAQEFAGSPFRPDFGRHALRLTLLVVFAYDFYPRIIRNPYD